jgi:hypothetical protein
MQGGVNFSVLTCDSQHTFAPFRCLVLPTPLVRDQSVGTIKPHMQSGVNFSALSCDLQQPFAGVVSLHKVREKLRTQTQFL